MKKILVIGASGGIGNKVALHLLEEGYKVIGTYCQHLENLENLRRTNEFSALQLDLKDKTIVSDSAKGLGVLYGIVNCSGIVRFEGEDIESDIDTWNETIAVNLTGNY